jgi:hypothetical protein
MSSLNSLYVLIQSLSPEEKKVIHSFIISFDSRGDSFKSKSEKLFNLLCQSKETLNEREIEFFLYGKESTATFSRLLIRLREKILEALFLNVNIKRELIYDNTLRSLLEVRKRMSYAQMMIYRKHFEIGKFLLESCIDISKQNEYYEELVSIVKIKIQTPQFVIAQNDLEKLNTEYAHWNLCKEAVYQAKLAYTRFNLTPQKAFEETEMSVCVERLKKDYAETQSSTVAYYWYLIESEYYLKKMDFNSAEKTLRKLVVLLEKNKKIYGEIAIGIALIKLAENELFLYKFDKTIAICQQARVLLGKDVSKENECLEIEFKAQLYSGKIQTALEIIREQSDRDLRKSISNVSTIRNHKLASVLFLQKHYFEANDLSREVQCYSDKDDALNFYITLLIVQSHIECCLNDITQYKLERIKKHVEQLKMVHHKNLRQHLITDVLIEFVKTEFSFRKTYHQMHDIFENLQSHSKEYQWQIESYEYVVFHEWFFAHTIKKPYNQIIARSLLKIKPVMPVDQMDSQIIDNIAGG